MINAGDLHWKIVSVYINKMNQVIIASIQTKFRAFTVLKYQIVELFGHDDCGSNLMT